MTPNLAPPVLNVVGRTERMCTR